MALSLIHIYIRGPGTAGTGQQPEQYPADPGTGAGPVSYTHLDVYKRQGVMWASSGNLTTPIFREKSSI